MAELSEVKKLVLGLSDREIMALLGLRSGKNKRNTDSSGRADGSWMDKQISGLNREGLSRLKELEAQLDDLMSAHHVDKRQVRYLRALKKMTLEVPPFFRETVDPKKLYNRLRAFCLTMTSPMRSLAGLSPRSLPTLERDICGRSSLSAKRAAAKQRLCGCWSKKLFRSPPRSSRSRRQMAGME